MITSSTKIALRASQRLLAAAAVLSLLASSASAETVNINVPKTAVAAAMNAAFSTMKVRLHNFGPKQGVSWLANDSYILLPGGSKMVFDIPEHSYKIAHNRYIKHYVNDKSTNGISVAVNSDHLVVTASFESHGEEIKGKCVRKLAGKWGECTLKMERDIHLDNSRLTVAFMPVAHKGSISIGAPSVDFKTDLKIASKLCQAFSGICGRIENTIRNKLTNQIKATTSAHLKSSLVRDAIANAVRNSTGIKKLIDPKWKVTKVASQGANYVVTVERPGSGNTGAIGGLTN
jgi:hypothetical protein